MKVVVSFDCNNSAFVEESFPVEVELVMKRAIDKLKENIYNEFYGKSMIRDTNGNVVGSCQIVRGK